MRMASLDVCDEADAAGVLVEGGIIEAMGGRVPEHADMAWVPAMGNVGIGGILPQSRSRALLRKRVCRAHWFSRLTLRWHPPPGTHFPPSPRAGAAARRLNYVKQAAF